MSGLAAGFTSGLLSVLQALLVRPDCAGTAGFPLTREDWYTREAGCRTHPDMGRIRSAARLTLL
jgi:hypothetical protein